MGAIGSIMDIVAWVLLIGGIVGIIYNIVAWRTAEFAVTNLRVIREEGLLKHKQSDLADLLDHGRPVEGRRPRQDARLRGPRDPEPVRSVGRGPADDHHEDRGLPERDHDQEDVRVAPRRRPPPPRHLPPLPRRPPPRPIPPRRSRASPTCATAARSRRRSTRRRRPRSSRGCEVRARAPPAPEQRRGRRVDLTHTPGGYGAAKLVGSMNASPAATADHRPIEIVLPIEGMTCASCVNRIERFLRQDATASSRRDVNLATETGDGPRRPGASPAGPSSWPPSKRPATTSGRRPTVDRRHDARGATAEDASSAQRERAIAARRGRRLDRGRARR